jgi:hypothetical protein
LDNVDCLWGHDWKKVKYFLNLFLKKLPKGKILVTGSVLAGIDEKFCNYPQMNYWIQCLNVQDTRQLFVDIYQKKYKKNMRKDDLERLYKEAGIEYRHQKVSEHPLFTKIWCGIPGRMYDSLTRLDENGWGLAELYKYECRHFVNSSLSPQAIDLEYSKSSPDAFSQSSRDSSQPWRTKNVSK